jgi:hypothetical protein
MDLLCRSKTSLDARVCKPLLGSCRTRRNVEIVEHVTECMVLKLDTTADILDGKPCLQTCIRVRGAAITAIKIIRKAYVRDIIPRTPIASIT